MTNLSRTSEDSLRTPLEHPPIMKDGVGTQSPSSVGFCVGFGFVTFHSVDLIDGGIENDAVYLTYPFVHCKAFS